MPALLRTLSLVLAMTALVGTTSFPTSLVAPTGQAIHGDGLSTWSAAALDVGMCLPDPAAERP